MPIFLNTYGSTSWQEVIEKIIARIQSWGGRWLNPARKSVLLKSVLSSLSIFQCFGLLTPKFTLEKISRALRSFLCAGGKTNTKKFHLLNWKQFFQPLNKGGLAIRDPILMNTSLGEKLVWRLIIGNEDWWKTTLFAKYSTSSRLCCLDGPTPPLLVSLIWRLLKNSSPLIKSNLSWALGNIAHINIWTDDILDREPLNSLVSLCPLKYW